MQSLVVTIDPASRMHVALTRRTATLALVVGVAAACASPTGLPEEPAEVPTESVVAGASAAGPVSHTGGGEVQAAAPVPSGMTSPSPAASPHGTTGTSSSAPEPVELPATVEVLQPDYLVDAGGELGHAELEEITSLAELRHVAPVARHDARISGPADDLDESIMVVDPSEFRPLTPEVTAQAVGVWERLADGDVVVRHDIANDLGLELGGNVLLATEGGSRVARVGALASNGTPPVAAVLVPWSIGRELGIARPNSVVVAAAEDQAEGAREALSGILPDAGVERRRPPQQQTASAGGSTRLEPFDYTDFGDGTIAIDPAWVARHIKTVEIPGIATTRCHELMIPQLLAALDEIRAVGLYDHFKPEQFGGCWVARHIDWDPSKPLSNHAWGIAIDFNTHDNWLGEEPQMDRRIVEIFGKWGFEWGGHWRRPDGMHFELDRIVRPSGG